MRKTLIISVDAVCDAEYDNLCKYPVFAAFSRRAAVFRRVKTIFLSNTYPVHASVVTGVTPEVHGLISNTEPCPTSHPEWICNESAIRAKTLWQAAKKSGIQTAAVLWPVTAFSKSIRYNIPETHIRLGENQVFKNLAAGSKLLQIKMILRHGKLLDGIKQPALDAFSTACMADILLEHAPGLALIHLTAYDVLCHECGRGSDEANLALKTLDDNLGRLLDAAREHYDVIVFSDHGQINTHTVINPNNILASLGLLCVDGTDFICGELGCFFECCGGSAFFHAGTLTQEAVESVRLLIEKNEGFRRFLTYEEMGECGRKDVAFGFCASAGFYYGAHTTAEKATHGYPLDMPDYEVFYLVRGCGCEAGSQATGGSLLDIAALAARNLEIKF